jgi:hypothetical protein
MALPSTIITCSCCFTECPPGEYIQCGHVKSKLPHFICNPCVIMGVDNAIGEQKPFMCVQGCERKYTLKALFHVVTDKKRQKLYKLIYHGQTQLFADDNTNRDPSIVYCCVPMIRPGGGCNKLTCPRCKSYWCYACKNRMHHCQPHKH